MELVRSLDFGRMVAGRLAAVALVASLAVPAVAKDVPYVPTPQSVVDAMLDMAKVTKSDYLIDLGSGDGRIVITAAKQFGTEGFGVDIDPERIIESNQNAKDAGVSDKVEFIEADLFTTDFSKATVLTMYLLPQVNLRLRPVILDTLKPGTRIVSHAFDMGDWEPDQRREVDGKQVFYWAVPAKVAGSWRVKEGEQTRTVQLSQTYQMLKGQAEGGSAVEGRVDGTTITLKLPGADGKDRTLTGMLQGDRITGKGWTADRVGG